MGNPLLAQPREIVVFGCPFCSQQFVSRKDATDHMQTCQDTHKGWRGSLTDGWARYGDKQ